MIEIKVERGKASLKIKATMDSEFEARTEILSELCVAYITIAEAYADFGCISRGRAMLKMMQVAMKAKSMENAKGDEENAED